MGTIKLSTQLISANKTIAAEDAVENITSVMKQLGIYLASLHQQYNYDVMISSISNTLDELSNVLINAGCNPDYVEKYKKWGKFGWSFNSSINKKFFLSMPQSLQEADSLMQEYCKTEEITKMMKELNATDINKQDLEEAYFAYINQKYKSCAMLLFSLLDRQLINRSFVNKEGHLKTGAGVIGELKKVQKHTRKTHICIICNLL